MPWNSLATCPQTAALVANDSFSILRCSHAILPAETCLLTVLRTMAVNEHNRVNKPEGQDPAEAVVVFLVQETSHFYGYVPITAVKCSSYQRNPVNILREEFRKRPLVTCEHDTTATAERFITGVNQFTQPPKRDRA